MEHDNVLRTVSGEVHMVGTSKSPQYQVTNFGEDLVEEESHSVFDKRLEE